MFKIHGKVVATQRNGESLAGLTILAIDTLDGTPAVVATATTATDGTFCIALQLGDVIQLFRADPESSALVLERAATLHLTVLGDGVTLSRTDLSLTMRELLDGTCCTELPVDSGPRNGERARFGSASSTGGCRYFVRGVLRRPDGSPVASTRIEVLEKRLRANILLGTTKTDHDGGYLIVYSKTAPCDATRPDKDIYVRAIDATETEIAASEVFADVAADVTIDLVVGNVELRGPARSTGVWRAIESRLDGLSLGEVTADDVETLAGATREDVLQVAYVARAAQLESATGVTRDAFYAFANAGLPTTLVGILGQDRETLQAALEKGEADNIVPAWNTGQVDEILDALEAKVIDLSVPETNPETSLLGELLLTGGVANALPRQFIEGYLTRTGTVEEFWADFRSTHGDQTTDTVQFTLAAGSLTGNHIPLVEALQSMRGAAEISHARDLAKLTASDWEAILDPSPGPGPGAPATFPGATDTERITNYAAALSRIWESAYPTTAVTGGLSRAAALPEVVELVDLNPAFDIVSTQVDAFFDGSPAPVLPVGDPDQLRRDVKLVQRLHAIAPAFGRGDAVATLLSGGIMSAQQVTRMGLGALSDMFEATLGKQAVHQIYERAVQQTARVATYVARHSAPFLNPSMWVLSIDPSAIWPDDRPTLESLFGPQGFCACEQCRSVFGPAAYLAALLLFLRDQVVPSSPDGTLLGILSQRRPDIVHILLNCENANTVMPTIDLSLEVLERRVKLTTPDWETLQTTWSVDELRAHPEHLHLEAYEDVLSDAIFPWSLPFDLFVEEARGYLEHLGVRLHEVMAALRGHVDAEAHAIAAETLRLSPTQAEVVEGRYTYANPGDPWGQPQGSWASDLADARLFVKQAGLDYEGLLDLLHSDYYVAPSDLNPKIELEHDPEQPCTLDGATLTELTANRLERLHRFTRLSRRIGWSLFDLDIAIRALGTNAADALEPEELGPPVDEPTFLGRLAGVVTLLRRFPGTTRAELCAWFGLLDTRRNRHDEPSFHETVFVDKTVAATSQPFSAGDGQTDLDEPQPTLSDDDRTQVAAALELSDEDLAALIASVEAQGVDTERNLLTLTRLFRRASLARSLGTTVRDLVRFVDLSGQQPFLDGVTPHPDVAHTERFIERFSRLSQTPFSVAELDYLLRHQFETGEPVALTADRIGNVFIDLIRGLQDIAAETTASDDALSMLRARLGEVIDDAFVDAAMRLIQGEDVSETSPSELEAELEEFLSSAEVDLLFEEPETAADPRTVAQRAEETLASLLVHIRTKRMTALVIQRLSTGVGIDSATGELLLQSLDGGTALQQFIDDAFVSALDFEHDAEAIKNEGFPEQAAQTLSAQFELYEQLYKAGLVLKRFGMSYDAARWLLDNATDLQLLDILSLPVSGPASSFEGWEKLARLVLLRDRLFRDGQVLLDLVAGVSPTGALLSAELDALADATGWDRDELDVLVAPTFLNVDGPAVRSLDGLERLDRAFAVLRRLGVGAARALSWVNNDIDAAAAQSIKSTTRGKYTPQRWPDVITPLRDKLREQQRDALVDYVLATTTNPELRTPNDLLGELLIDVMGQACQRTSRIVQATASVQLLVQRALMGLEPDVDLNEQAELIWQWMAYFRVWEANRRVFCYPENYVEPELRVDQSPFFRKLADALLEGEPTDRRVSRAYLGYLKSLDEVARLHAAGLYHQVERDEFGETVVDIMHAFARTITKPYRYYYRRFVDGAYWTAWEKVELNIEHPYVIPLVVDRRLLVMWPIILEDADEVESVPGGNNVQKPKKFLRIRMNLSEYIDGEWTQPLTADDDQTLENKFFKGAFGDLIVFPEIISPAYRIHYETRHRSSGVVEIYPRFQRDNGDIHYLPPLVLDHREVRRAESVLAAGAVPVDKNSYAGPANTGFFHQAFRGQEGLPVQVPTRDAITQGLVPSPKFFDAPSDFQIVPIRHNKRHYQNVEFVSEEPFFYQDRKRVFFVMPFEEHGSPHVYGGGSVARTFRDDNGLQLELMHINTGGFAAIDQEPVETETPPQMTYVVDSPVMGGASKTWTPVGPRKRFDFRAFYHPYVPRMIGRVRRAGVRGLLDPPAEGEGSELRRQLTSKSVSSIYDPPPSTPLRRLDREEFDFSSDGAYSEYNWELFFHGPMLVATRLMSTNRFAEAREWLHTIFDPTEIEGDAPQRYWKIKPFYEALDPATIIEQLESLSYDGSDPEKIALRQATEKQIEQWRKNPFDPHLLARLRPLAYQRATVMKYLDLLIAWGDHLYRQATRETIGQALQLYVLAAQILGPRPERVGARTPDDRSFDDLADDLDSFANALVELENHNPLGHAGSWQVASTNFTYYASTLQPEDEPLQYMAPLQTATVDTEIEPVSQSLALSIDQGFVMLATVLTYLADGSGGEQALYFCVPPNDKLLGYWDTVADRLFKIRNCLDIEGAHLDLPLFQPPIDPALLVKAAAAGIDISSAVSALAAPLPHYRFRTMLAVAKEFAAEVRSLGQALQAALERKDAEALAELRVTHELRLVEATRAIREQQIEEAKQAVVALVASREVVAQRQRFYQERQRRIETEIQQQGHLHDAEDDIESAQAFELMANVLGLIPNIQIGIQGFASSPTLTATFGGTTFSQIYSAIARWRSSDASIKQGRSSLAGIEAGLMRRDEDWDQEVDAADLELQRIEQEVATAQIRIQIAERELQNHDLQIRQAKQVDDFVKSRFTRSELYGFLAKEIGRTYYHAYQLAFDLAKRAERSYQLELALDDSSFIQFGYWDNQLQGLLAGDKLLHDLRRLEAAHLQNNRRELELTKRVSLAQVDPVALLLLREKGECWLSVDEVLFDMMHPGHYLRRIKSVAVTVSTVGDPVAEIPVTLTLQRSAIRRSPSTDPGALIEDHAAGTQQIATSTGDDDAGLFERNFNDERYLPFEGRGAVSTWRIQLPKTIQPFDYGRITDVVVHIAYTARNGGELFREAVENDVQTMLAAFVREQSFGQGLMHMFSMRQSFADDWNRFLDPPPASDRILELDVSADRFPWRFYPGEIEVTKVWLLTVFTDAAAADAAGVLEPGTLPFQIDLPGLGTPQPVPVTPPFATGSGAVVYRVGMGEHGGSLEVTTGTWTIELPIAELPDASELQDLIIVVQYQILQPSPPPP